MKKSNVKYETDTPVQGKYRDSALSALEKFQKLHEEQRKKMTKEERLIDERTFNYCFNDGETVILDSENIRIKDDMFYPVKLEKYIGKKGIVKRCYSDLHAFGRGDSYMIDVEFDDELVKNIPPYYLININK